MAALGITAFKGSVDSCATALAESGIPYHQIERHRPRAAGSAPETALDGCGWDALAITLEVPRKSHFPAPGPISLPLVRAGVCFKAEGCGNGAR